ncbi:hypothetical protein GMSM_05130 [Geomonas sp. Red276]
MAKIEGKTKKGGAGRGRDGAVGGGAMTGYSLRVKVSLTPAPPGEGAGGRVRVDFRLGEG